MKYKKDDLLIIGVLLLTTFLPMFLLVGGGFELGKWYTMRKADSYLRTATAGVCEECRAGGEQAGLKTCSDVLEKEDRNGNY